MSAYKYLTWSLLVQLLFLANTDAIMCYICSQTRELVSEGGDCASQFQYECSAATLLIPADSKIYCQTTRRLVIEGQYTVTKECVSEKDFRQAYPTAQNTCYHGRTLSGEDITACICDTSFCNMRPLVEQMSDVNRTLAHAIPPQPAVITFNADRPPVTAFHVNANVNLDAGKGLQGFSFQPSPGAPWLQTDSSRGAINPADVSRAAQAPPVALPAAALRPPAPAPSVTLPPPSLENLTKPPTTLGFEVQDAGTLPDGFVAIDPAMYAGLAGQTAGAQVPVVGEQLPVAETQPQPTAVTTSRTINRQDTGSLNTPALTTAPASRSGGYATTKSVPTSQTKTLNAVDGSKADQTPSAPAMRCSVCGEGDLNDGADCVHSQLLNCSSQYPIGAKLYCFTRDTFLTTTAKHAIEKLCISEEALQAEYGENITEGCYSTWQGRIKFCICSTSECNAMSMSEQLVLHPPIDVNNRGRALRGSNQCYMCAETDLNGPADCNNVYEHDCNLIYSTGTQVSCLTRQTKLANGLYSFEKRCVSKEDHQQQYPGMQVVHQGCGAAWNGYVQYCVCSGDLCNKQSLRDQQNAVGFIVPQTHTPPQATEQQTTQRPHIAEHATTNRRLEFTPLPRERRPGARIETSDNDVHDTPVGGKFKQTNGGAQHDNCMLPWAVGMTLLQLLLWRH